MSEPHFYQLRKEAVGRDCVLPGRTTERCERNSLRLAPCFSNSNGIRQRAKQRLKKIVEELVALRQEGRISPYREFI